MVAAPLSPQPARHAPVFPPTVRQANSLGASASGAFYSAEAFVDAWVSPRPKAPATRPDYGPQYNGIGECPF